MSVSSTEEIGLDFVVEDKDESSTSTSDNVGERSLEEGSTSFLLVDFGEAIHGTSVHELVLWEAGLHHQSSTDSVEWVRGNTSGDSDELSEGPGHEEVSFLGIWEESSLASVEHTEVRGTVSDDTDNGDSETSVKSNGSIRLGDLEQAVSETSELTLSSRSDISSKTGSCEVEWVDEAEGSSTSGSTGSAVTNEEVEWLLLGIEWVEILLVEIFASEVECLSWEITNDVSEVSSPEGNDTLLRQDTSEAVANTVVSLISSNVLVGVLNLEQELDTLNWGDESLGDCSGDTTDQEIGDHTPLSLWCGLCHLSSISVD